MTTITGADGLLDVRDVSVEFRTPRGELRAVDRVSFSLQAGQTLGIVGESGSGKSVLSRAVMGLLEGERDVRVAGQVLFGGHDVRALTPRARYRLWGRDIAMVFQDPGTALNPTKTIESHLTQALQLHLGMNRREAHARSLELLAEVGIPDPRRRLRQYPHEMSGGMRQRLCIALAISGNPRLLIADEPTTALDVTVQRQILDLLHQVTDETQMATILISHDLSVVSNEAQRVMVMYAGRAAELADAQVLRTGARHPYSGALLAAAPRLGAPAHTRLLAIPGRVPDLARPIDGCPFAPRCHRADSECFATRPQLTAVDGDVSSGHLLACHHPLPIPTKAKTCAR